MIVLLNKKLGYSKIRVFDDFGFEQYLCFLLCYFKNPVWNFFFGWRKTNKDDSMIFIFPNRIADLIFDLNARLIKLILIRRSSIGTE